LHRTHVSLITIGQLSFRVRNPSGDQDFVGRAGSVCVFPSGFDETHFSIAGSKFEAIVVELDPARLEALVGKRMATATDMLAPQSVVPDRYIAMLLRAMASEVVQVCPGGALYAQALSLALATYLARKFFGRAEQKGRQAKPTPAKRRPRAQAARLEPGPAL